MNQFESPTELPRRAEASPLWNPYLAGVLLGLTLLASLLTSGRRLGPRAGIARIGAVAESLHHAAPCGGKRIFWGLGHDPLRTTSCSCLSARCSADSSRPSPGGVDAQLESGQPPRAGLAWRWPCRRRVGRFREPGGGGCTSGQALTGGAMLVTGSLLFLGAMFAGGYAVAWFVRRQWQ